MSKLINNKITWIEPYYDLILNLIPRDVRSILDVGAGSGIFGFILKKTRTLATITAIEPFSYDLSHYDKVIKEEWQYCISGKYTYDVIVSLEMIEHLEKEYAIGFLDFMKDKCRKIIIATPYEFSTQPEYDDNPYQKHLCLITVDDFIKHNYRVYLICSWNNRIINTRIMANKHLLFLLKILNPLGLKITNIIGVYNHE